MAVKALFDEKRRGEIRRALSKGEPVPRPRATDSPALYRAKELAEGLSGILEGRDSKEEADIARYRLDLELIRAVMKGNQLAVEAALARGARVDARRFPFEGTFLGAIGGDGTEHERMVTQTQGDTALMIAVQNNDLGMVELLIHRKADVNARVNYGVHPTPTALAYAERLGFSAVAECLRQHGAVM
ncbi:hypothetical protein L0Y65_06145 [Candidatus Micrarchaeota archaeon]|nr:hypothetical protein [Candidatus Micrarchaeota archaeon]